MSTHDAAVLKSGKPQIWRLDGNGNVIGEGMAVKVALVHLDEEFVVRVSAPELDLELSEQSRHDFEGALRDLWDRLESMHLRLGIVRYTRNAFVSSMSRQMSGGASCYLVQPGVAAGPKRLVHVVSGAPKRALASPAQNRAYLDRWIRIQNSQLRLAGAKVALALGSDLGSVGLLVVAVASLLVLWRTSFHDVISFTTAGVALTIELVTRSRYLRIMTVKDSLLKVHRRRGDRPDDY